MYGKVWLCIIISKKNTKKIPGNPTKFSTLFLYNAHIEPYVASTVDLYL